MHIAFVGADHRGVPYGPEADAYTRVCAEPRADGNAWVRRRFSIFGFRSLLFLSRLLFLDFYGSRALDLLVSTSVPFYRLSILLLLVLGCVTLYHLCCGVSTYSFSQPRCYIDIL